MKKIIPVLSIAMSLMSAPSWAINPIANPNLAAFASQSQMDTLITNVGIGAAHHAYQPATPLGLIIGLEIDGEVTAFVPSQAFINVVNAISPGANIPSFIPIPKLNLHKGLPWGIDLGFSWISIPTSTASQTLSTMGFEGKWAFITGVAVPSIAVRFSYATSKIYYLSTNTMAVDLIASKNLAVIDPYLGAGMQFWNGTFDTSAATGGFAAGISSTSTGSAAHVFGGLQIKLAILHITGEYDYSFAGQTTYGAKAGFGF